ncbi:hypothetical protein N9M79_02830 [Alphaproteobacteria bacterium]|nr:hypothetical protein [Alphaproteobacteria bacterium]
MTNVIELPNRGKKIGRFHRKINLDKPIQLSDELSYWIPENSSVFPLLRHKMKRFGGSYTFYEPLEEKSTVFDYLPDDAGGLLLKTGELTVVSQEEDEFGNAIPNRVCLFYRGIGFPIDEVWKILDFIPENFESPAIWNLLETEENSALSIYKGRYEANSRLLVPYYDY